MEGRMNNSAEDEVQKSIIPPTIAQYQYYVEKWKEHIHVPKIRDGTPVFETSPFQMDAKIPVARCGQFAIAYYWKGPSKEDMVVRFFTRPIDSRDEMRYLSIGVFTADSPYFVNFEYIRYGLWCSAPEVRPAKVYPLVLMNRAIGSHLDDFITYNLGESEILIDVAKEWKKMTDYLSSKKIAHGDLQHGNIVVSPDGKIKLIDYDGVYVDAIAPLGSSECGHPNYNHPARRNEHFGPLMDRFSQIAIYVSIIAASHDPEIWTKFHRDEALLFTKEDFLKPDSSAIFSKLCSSRIDVLRNLSNSLKNWCKSSNPLNFQMASLPLLSESDVSIILGKGAGAPLKGSVMDNVAQKDPTTAWTLDWLSVGSVMAPSTTQEKPKETGFSPIELPKEAPSSTIMVDHKTIEKVEKKAQKKCLACGEFVDTDVIKCPICGKEANKEPMKEENIFQRAIDDCRALIGDAEMKIGELEVVGIDTNDLRQKIEKASLLLQESSVSDASEMIKKGLDGSDEIIKKVARKTLTDIRSLLQSDLITPEDKIKWKSLMQKAEELIHDGDFFGSYQISKRTQEEIRRILRAEEKQSIIERMKKCENLLIEIDGRGYTSRWGFEGAKYNLNSARDSLSKEDYEKSSSTLKEAEQSIEMSYGHYIGNVLIANIESDLKRTEQLGISLDPTVRTSAVDSIVSAKKKMAEGDFMSSVMILDRIIPILSAKIKEEGMKQAELTAASEAVSTMIRIENQRSAIEGDEVKQASITPEELKPTVIDAVVAEHVQDGSGLAAANGEESLKMKEDARTGGKEKTLGLGRIGFRKKSKGGVKDVSMNAQLPEPALQKVTVTTESKTSTPPAEITPLASTAAETLEDRPSEVEPLEFECPECGKLTNTGNVNCPHCGALFGEEQEISKEEMVTAKLIESSEDLDEEPPPPELSMDEEDTEKETIAAAQKEGEGRVLPPQGDTKLRSKVARDSPPGRPPRPSKKAVQLTEIEKQFQGIVRSMEGLDTSFRGAKVTLADASRAIASKNYKKAMNILNAAETQIETEKRIVAWKTMVDNLRSYLPSSDIDENEKQLDSDLKESVEKGKFEESMEIIKKLEMKVRSKLLKNVDSFFDLALPPDEIITIGRWNQIEVVVLNTSPLSARFLSFEGMSKSGTVEVMENKKPTIGPNSQTTIAVNILPSMQGDMPFEIIAEIEIDGKPVKVKKRASVLVISPPSSEEDGLKNSQLSFEAVQKLAESFNRRSPGGVASESKSGIDRFNTPARTDGFPSEGRTYPPRAASSDQGEDRIIGEREIMDGSVDYWSSVIHDCFTNKAAINLVCLSQKDGERIRNSKGFQNLLRSIFTMEFEPVFMWEDWSETKGIVGDESSSRGFRLLLQLMLSKNGSIEFEHDNSINSSNKDYFTNTLHILAGYSSLDRNRKREIKRWEIEVMDADGNTKKYAIDKMVEKDKEKGMSKSIFVLNGANARTDLTNKKVVRRVKTEKLDMLNKSA